MKILEFLSAPQEFCQRGGPNDQIVLSSRVRLARNVADIPFPGHAKKPDRVRSYELLMPLVAGMPQLGPDPFAGGLDKLTPLDKQVLVERHLISRELAAKSGGSGFVLNRAESFCVMVNEEDHLRMQALRPGLQLKQAWLALDALDSSLQEKVPFAFTEQYGYLTACPTNLGTGIRVSAMLHLPGLVLAEHINQIIQAVNKLGLAVRGLYGEGTEALGNIFQVSNQQTLGESESEIVERLNKVALQIIEAEQNARAAQLEKKPRQLFNQIGRAYGALSQAHVIASKETMNQLSLLRLGVDLGMFEGIQKSAVDELFLISQPWHLQMMHPEKLDAEQRDALRAEMLRDRMKRFPAPDHTRATAKPA